MNQPCVESSLQIGRTAGRFSPQWEAFTLRRPSASPRSYSVRLERWPRLPFTDELPQIVRALLRRGEGTIVLDLACVSNIDAAGIGELVRAYNITIAGNGTLRIANTNRRVREMLERVGLYDHLNAAAPFEPEARRRV
jgi:anti-anti-sigma factor